MGFWFGFGVFLNLLFASNELSPGQYKYKSNSTKFPSLKELSLVSEKDM